LVNYKQPPKTVVIKSTSNWINNCISSAKETQKIYNVNYDLNLRAECLETYKTYQSKIPNEVDNFIISCGAGMEIIISRIEKTKNLSKEELDQLYIDTEEKVCSE